MANINKWKEEETNLLRNNILRLGITEGSRLTSQQLGKSDKQCLDKACYITKKENLNVPKNPNKPDWNKVVRILRLELQKNPGNLNKAFRNTAKRTNIPFNTLREYYYTNPKSKVYKDNIGVVFFIAGKKAKPNAKNYNANKEDIRVPFDLWKLFKSLFSKKK